MDLKLLYLCFLFLATGYCQSASDVIAITKIVMDAAGFISSICTIGATIDTYAFEHSTGSMQSNLKWLKNTIADISNNLKYVKENLAKDVMKEGNIQEVTNLDDEINEFFIKIKHYYDVSEETIEKQTDLQLFQVNGVVSMIKKIRTILAGPNSLIKKLSNEEKKECRGVSEQRWFYNLCSKYILTEMKALAVVNVTYTYREKLPRMQDKIPTIQKEFDGYVTEMKEKINKAVSIFREVIAKSSRLHQSCDLKANHRKDRTFTYFSRLFQTVIYTRTDIKGVSSLYLFGEKVHEKAKGFENSILKVCPAEYDDPIKPDCNNNGNCELKVRECGTVIRCKSNDDDIVVCASTDRESLARYFYALKEMKSEGVSSCEANNGVTKTIKNTCICLCEEMSDTEVERLISLEDVHSDIEHNRIITGIQLAKRNKKLYFRIQETELLPNKKLNLTYHDDNDDDDGYTSRFYSWDKNINTQGVYKNVYSGAGVIYFDKFDIPEGAFLTGIRFGKEQVSNDLGVRLSIRITYVEPGTYKLTGKSEWLKKDHDVDSRIKIKLRSPDAPNNVEKEHKAMESFKEKRYVELNPSDLESKDAGQTAGPYFDIQRVDTKDFICSVALDHAGAEGSMGYIKVVVEICDLTPLVKTFDDITVT